MTKSLPLKIDLNESQRHSNIYVCHVTFPSYNSFFIGFFLDTIKKSYVPIRNTFSKKIFEEEMTKAGGKFTILLVSVQELYRLPNKTNYS